jgi:catalase (peroxidase I)
MRTFAIAIAALASAATFAGPALGKAPPHHPTAKAHAATKSAANPISSDQAKAVAELAKAGLSIQADLNNAIASASDDPSSRRRGGDNGAVVYIECFQILEGATAELTGNLKELLVAAATASLAKDPTDLNTSMGFARLAVADVGTSLELVERVTSQRPAPVCRSSRLYRDQVDRLQAFAHEVRGITDDLSVATGPR